jgi:hypothetical protein
MKELSVSQMEQIEGGTKWACVGIAAVALVSTGVIGGFFFIAGAVAAGCFD